MTLNGGRFIFMNTGEDPNGDRSWDDCWKYGFISSGGNSKFQSHARSLKVGDRVLAYLKRHGYVGIGEVIAEAVPEKGLHPTRSIQATV